MEDDSLTYQDYAILAHQPLDEIECGCDIQAFRASGPGGQCVNTTDSAVRMLHRSSGIVVTSRESRSQFRNRQLCLQKLRMVFEQRSVPPKVRHTTKIPRRTRERRLADKHHRATNKSLRGRVDGE